MILEPNDIRNFQALGNIDAKPHLLGFGQTDVQTDIPIPQTQSKPLELFGDQMPVDDTDIVLTDEQIGDLVHKALHASAFRQLRGLQAYCDNGRVTLQGRLPTFYLKQVAQTAICSLPGVREIDNDIRVASGW